MSEQDIAENGINLNIGSSQGDGAGQRQAGSKGDQIAQQLLAEGKAKTYDEAFHMACDSIHKGVVMVTIEKLRVKEEEVTPTASFQEDLGADSLDVVELVMALEDQFEIKIPDDVVSEIKTVQSAVDYIVQQKV